MLFADAVFLPMSFLRGSSSKAEATLGRISGRSGRGRSKSISENSDPDQMRGAVQPPAGTAEG